MEIGGHPPGVPLLLCASRCCSALHCSRRRSAADLLAGNVQSLAYLAFQFNQDIRIVAQERPGVFPALADAFPSIGEPRPTLLKNILLGGDIQQIALL